MENERTFANILNETGVLVYTTKGVSMRPLLRQGKDVVVIEKRKGHCKKYDAVLFQRRNGQYVLHRILKKKNDKYWIVGDNCFSGETVNEEQIIGIMTSLKRNGKTIKVTDWAYKLYVHLWCDVYPVRFLLLRSRSFAYRCCSFLKRRVFG